MLFLNYFKIFTGLLNTPGDGVDFSVPRPNCFKLRKLGNPEEGIGAFFVVVASSPLIVPGRFAEAGTFATSGSGISEIGIPNREIINWVIQDPAAIPFKIRVF